MIAAIYARKSTDQTGVADEAKSVERQIDHARAYATKRVGPSRTTCIFVDDGISGAEVANRPSFLRLMNALTPRPPFQVLVMSEESRLGRESIETAFAMKQLVQGRRPRVLLPDRRRAHSRQSDGQGHAEPRDVRRRTRAEKERQRTYDAMIRKAREGHVTGGLVFGYDNVQVLASSGKKSHVARVINEPQAAIVREIFDRYASGWG